MDYTAIAQLVGSLGFPIVACIMLYIRLDKQAAEHKEEVSKLSEAIHNNTLVMQKLIDKLGEDDNVVRL